MESDENYDRLFEQLSECPKEQQREFVLKHYSEMKYMNQGQDPLYLRFIQTKQKFTQCEATMKTIDSEIQELEYARIKTKGLDESDQSDFSGSESDEDLDIDKENQDQVSAEDQISEMLDNLSSSAYERNYKEAQQYYQILREMLSSEKYGPLLKKPEIKKTVDQCYKTLCELLLTDYENENPVFTQQELIDHLIKINQQQALIQKFLEIKSKRLQESTQKYFNSTFGLDIDQLEKVLTIFLKGLLNVCEDFEKQFKEMLTSVDFLYCRVSNWVQDGVFSFYNDISPSLYQSYDYEEILLTLKELIGHVSDQEQNGISLTVPFQKYIIPDLEIKMDDLYLMYNQNLRRLLVMDTEKLYPIFMLKQLTYCEDELSDPSSKPINPDGQVSQLIFPQEIKIRGQITTRQIFAECQQPCGIVTCYFWNVVYRLTDATLDFTNLPTVVLITQQYGSSFQIKLRAFVSSYLKLFRTKQAQLVQPGKATVIYQISNAYASFALCNLLSQYLQSKRSKLIVSQTKEWGQTTQMWFQECSDLIQTLFNGRLLEQIPFLFANQGRVYCQQLTTSQQDIIKPTTLFLQIAYLINDLKQDLISILPKQPLNFFVTALHEQIKYMIEYVIYWFYHNIGKNNEVFFMERKDRDKLNLNITQLNIFLQQNSLKLSYFTQYGLTLFAYDMTFLSNLYSKYLIPAVQQTNDQFLKKTIALYNKEKNLSIDTKSISERHLPSIEKYINNALDQDLIAIGVAMKKQDSSSPNNFVFKQSINEVQ